MVSTLAVIQVWKEITTFRSCSITQIETTTCMLTKPEMPWSWQHFDFKFCMKHKRAAIACSVDFSFFPNYSGLQHGLRWKLYSVHKVTNSNMKIKHEVSDLSVDISKVAKMQLPGILKKQRCQLSKQVTHCETLSQIMPHHCLTNSFKGIGSEEKSTLGDLQGLSASLKVVNRQP